MNVAGSIRIRWNVPTTKKAGIFSVFIIINNLPKYKLIVDSICRKRTGCTTKQKPRF